MSAEIPYWWCFTIHLGDASDWSYSVGNLLQSIRSTTKIWVVTWHQYEISAFFSHMSFHGETRGRSQNWTKAFGSVKQYFVIIRNFLVSPQNIALYWKMPRSSFPPPHFNNVETTWVFELGKTLGYMCQTLFLGWGRSWALWFKKAPQMLKANILKP